LVELGFDFGFEVRLDLVGVAELGEGPAAVGVEVVGVGKYGGGEPIPRLVALDLRFGEAMPVYRRVKEETGVARSDFRSRLAQTPYKHASWIGRQAGCGLAVEDVSLV